MPPMIERLGELYHERLASLAVVKRKSSDPTLDRKGVYTTGVADATTFLAVAEWGLRRDAEAFRTLLVKAVRLEISLFHRYDAGEPISASYVGMTGGNPMLYNALAAADFELAHEAAELLGGRDEVEKQKLDHPSDLAQGYCLKALVLEEWPLFERWIEPLNVQIARRGGHNWAGYRDVFIALRVLDEKSANEGFAVLIDGHKRLTKGNGVLTNTPHEIVALWGIGFANLCRHRGLRIDARPPFIPEELLIAQP